MRFPVAVAAFIAAVLGISACAHVVPGGTSLNPSVVQSLQTNATAPAHIYVADAKAHAIVTYAAGNQAPVAAYSTLSTPFDIAEDAQGNLAVSYALTNQVVEYAPGFSGTIRTISIPQPDGVVYDSHGNLYVADMYDRVVKVFQPGKTSASYHITPLGAVYLYGGLVVQDGSLYVDVSNQGSGGVVERCPLAAANWNCRFTNAAGAYPGGIAFDEAGEFVVGGAGTFIWFAPPEMHQLRAQYLGVGNAIRGMRSYGGTVYAAVQWRCDDMPAFTTNSRTWALNLRGMTCEGSRVIAIAPDGTETSYSQGLQSPLGVAAGL